jgi:hypothetical protein
MKLKKDPHRRNVINSSAQPPSCVSQAVASPTPTVHGECSNVGTPPQLPSPVQQLPDQCIEMERKQLTQKVGYPYLSVDKASPALL